MNEHRYIDQSFDPVFDSRSRVLILGSFPSVASRANHFYYGNPRNRFWRVIATCTKERIPPDGATAQAIAIKERLLLDHGIALWDVVASCTIKGSADSSIRDVKPAALSRIFDEAHIEAIFANGRAAESLYRRHLEPQTNRPIVGLPSTSPANAAYQLDRLTNIWSKALTPYLIL
ncbi:MAG: DNA-deoxyinosine glycosylase [Eggerthellaceae bacterium]|jgi:hypoxanthine-DNA glycosylase|nr:DNA-deoxyinosine glycosylase [Eggerthellaceae bacterium]MCH4221636.1 DNA-deoxyinosine glycosylase [Eggerthellaceae bacterium]